MDPTACEANLNADWTGLGTAYSWDTWTGLYVSVVAEGNQECKAVDIVDKHLRRTHSKPRYSTRYTRPLRHVL